MQAVSGPNRLDDTAKSIAAEFLGKLVIVELASTSRKTTFINFSVSSLYYLLNCYSLFLLVYICLEIDFFLNGATIES